MKKYLLILVLLTLFIFPKPAFASEQTYYIHSDHLGSTAMVTDGEGNMVSEQNYYPYGNDRNQLPVTDYQLPVTERAYTSQISDIQTGLYYYNARYYSPKLAKFTQADSQMGPNRYLYTRNNPIKYVDSTGHQSNFSPIG